MRFCLVALVLSVLLLAHAGCTTETKRQWAEAMKDARGDNMEMGSRRQYKAP